MECRVCDGTDLVPAVDLGLQPWANHFLRPDEVGREPVYPLRVLYCQRCATAQLDYTVPKETMFGDHTYLSGVTRSLSEHFRAVAEEVDRRFRGGRPRPAVLDIGSNDGTQLKHFQALGYDVLGVEASHTTAAIAQAAGVETVNEFFNLDLARRLGRSFDVINAAGVFFHLEELHSVTETFLGHLHAGAPYVIGIAGSVAVGKSTTARIVQALLARWPAHPAVDLVTTDGFLLPNRVLEERGLMRRKGFPESYDVRRLLRFVSDLKAGRANVSSPVYSHLTYDIVPGEEIVVRQPDIVILEGLNVLQSGSGPRGRNPPAFVSDFFDFSVYVDAEAEHVRRWYLERFFTLRNTAFQAPASYFHRYARLSDAEAEEVASGLWREINEVNLRENILPTRERARLVLRKGPDHSVEEVRLRKI